MMIMLGVKEPLSVVPTTVNYLATIIPYEGLYDLLGTVDPFHPVQLRVSIWEEDQDQEVC